MAIPAEWWSRFCAHKGYQPPLIATVGRDTLTLKFAVLACDGCKSRRETEVSAAADEPSRRPLRAFNVAMRELAYTSSKDEQDRHIYGRREDLQRPIKKKKKM